MWKLPLVLALASCSAAESKDSKDANKEGSCDAKKYAPATKLAAYKPPADCKAIGGTQAPEALATEARARETIVCNDATTKLGVDFAKRQLVVTSRSFSPAQIGLDVYDDGKTLTFVSRQRSPCKDDPRPMPGPNSTFVFDAPAGARTFAEGSCTIASTCK